MMDMKKQIEEIYGQVVAWRRDFHMYPEVGNHEERTSKIVAETLKGFGLEVTTGVGGYGVVGLLRGAKEGKTIAIRADMDALPIQEKTTFDYVSKIDGVSHTCGHDGHTAMLLGTASILSRMKKELKGNVKFIFQPAEEVNPLGGAKPMALAGALENPKVDTIIGLHVFPFIPTGSFSIGKGPMMAAGDGLIIEVFGKAGHGAQPHLAKDALLAACQVVNSLQMVVSRQVDPLETAVVTIGKLQSGSVCNAIADYAIMEGTVRTFNPEVQENIIKAIDDIAQGVSKTTGTTVKVNYQRGYAAVVNDSAVVDMIRRASLKVLPAESVLTMEKPLSGSEDFSYFLLNGLPGAMIFLGGRIEGEEIFGNHHPKFNWDENAMKIGMTIEIATVLEYLG